METIRYAGFIWSAYAVTGLALAALVCRAVVDHRAQLKALARLSQAPGRRSTDG